MAQKSVLMGTPMTVSRQGSPLHGISPVQTLWPLLSHVEKSLIEAGKTAVWAEENKFTTYGNALRDDYHFVPIAVETFGSWGPIGHKFITDIGRTIAGITKNPKSTSFIFQAISMAVQRGNVQCVQGAYGELAFEELDEIFYIVKPNSIF